MCTWKYRRNGLAVCSFFKDGIRNDFDCYKDKISIETFTFKISKRLYLIHPINNQSFYVLLFVHHVFYRQMIPRNNWTKKLEIKWRWSIMVIDNANIIRLWWRLMGCSEANRLSKKNFSNYAVIIESNKFIFIRYIFECLFSSPIIGHIIRSCSTRPTQ